MNLSYRERCRIYKRQWYFKNRERILAKARERYQKGRINFCAYERKYYQEHRDERLTYAQKYRRTQSALISKYHKNYSEDNKHKISAQGKARYRSPLQECCKSCGSTENLDRHHPDYNDPLKIVTLCHSCHMKLHLGLKETKRSITI